MKRILMLSLVSLCLSSNISFASAPANQSKKEESTWRSFLCLQRRKTKKKSAALYKSSTTVLPTLLLRTFELKIPAKNESIVETMIVSKPPSHKNHSITSNVDRQSPRFLKLFQKLQCARETVGYKWAHENLGKIVASGNVTVDVSDDEQDEPQPGKKRTSFPAEFELSTAFVDDQIIKQSKLTIAQTNETCISRIAHFPPSLTSYKADYSYNGDSETRRLKLFTIMSFLKQVIEIEGSSRTVVASSCSLDISDDEEPQSCAPSSQS